MDTITNEYIVQSWNDQLVKFTSQQLADRLLPQAAKEFMQEVGLPKAFGIDRFPWAYLNETGDFETFHFNDSQYCVIGHGEFGERLCIETQNGEVVGVTRRGLWNFINSSIKAHVTFLTLFRTLFSKYPDEIPKDEIYGMKQQLLREDALAFSHPQQAWGIVLTEIEDANYG